MDFGWLDEKYKDSSCEHGGKKERDTGRFLDYSANVNPFSPDPRMLGMVGQTVARKEFYVTYPDSSYQNAREAIASYLGNGIGKDNIILTNGTIELIKIFCEAFTRGKSIIPTPTFCEYERFSRINGGNMLFIGRDDYLEDDTPDALVKEVGQGCGTMFVCNPNNPTGALVRRDWLLELAELLEEREIMLFVDEAFIDFAPQESLFDTVEEHENIVVGRSLTKILGIPGIRLGYGLANAKTMSYLRRAQMPWSVNNLAREIAERIGEFDDFIKESVRMLEAERRRMLDGLSQIEGMHISPPSANYIMLRIDGLDSLEIARGLRERGILVRRCDSFRGGDNRCVRLAVRDKGENEILLRNMSELYGNR